MSKKMIFKNISFLKEKDQIKFVINDKDDYNYANKIIKKYKPICSIYFQPVWGTNIKDLAEWIIKDELNVNLGLQLHKVIWGNIRGK